MEYYLFLEVNQAIISFVLYKTDDLRHIFEEMSYNPEIKCHYISSLKICR